jgi:hypothetical protein
MTDKRLPEEAPDEEDEECGDDDLDAGAESPAVSWYLIAVEPADPDRRDDDEEPGIGPVILGASGQDPSSMLLLTFSSADAQRAAKPHVTKLEHEGLAERLHEAAASYIADHAATVVPADGPVGEASDAITGWITGLVSQPVRGLSVGAGVPGALATPAADIVD